MKQVYVKLFSSFPAMHGLPARSRFLWRRHLLTCS